MEVKKRKLDEDLETSLEKKADTLTSVLLIVVNVHKTKKKDEPGVIGPGKAFANFKEWMADYYNIYGGRGDRVALPSDPVTGKRQVFGFSASPLHNPFPVGKSKAKDKEKKAEEEHKLRQVSLKKFEAYAIVHQLAQVLLGMIEAKVTGRPGATKIVIQLGCWCAPLDCHCHVLARLVRTLPSTIVKIVV